MKATNFKNAPRPKKVSARKQPCPTGKVKLSEDYAKTRAQTSDDIKGGMVAYKCRYGKKHWHIGHDPYSPTKSETDSSGGAGA